MFKNLLMGFVLVFAVSASAKEKNRTPANDSSVIERMIEKISSFPKNRIIIKHKYQVIADLKGCKLLSADYLQKLQENINNYLRQEEIKGQATVSRSNGVYKCNLSDETRIVAIVSGVFAESPDIPQQTLWFSSAEYTEDANAVDAADLVGEDSMWLFHSGLKTQSLKRHAAKVTKNSIKGGVFDEYLTARANIYFK